MKIIIKNNNGIILYIVLWAMVILSVLAVGLGWQTHVEFTLSKNFNGKINSKYIAMSGVNYCLDILKKDKETKEITKPDILNPLLYLKPIDMGSGSFKIINFQDEAGKMNINEINPNNYQIFSNLLVHLGVEQEDALTISSSIVDWIDNDKIIFNPPYGAEDDFYQTIGYATKNKPFDSIEEILLIRGMNKNIYQKLKDYITIYPTNGSLLINLDSASKEVLMALAENFIGGQTNTTLEDAQSLIEKIITYRTSQTDITLSNQERAVEPNKLSLNSKENAIFLSMQSLRQRVPQFVNIHIVATDQKTQASTGLVATLQLSDYTIKRWQRN